jgi:hypothetical protein
MRATASAIAMGLSALMFQGCALYRQGAPTEREFLEGLGSRPYVADAARTEAIISGARRLHICSRKSEVRQLMGEPDFGARTFDSNGERKAAMWTYAVRESATTAGTFEQAVAINVNSAGRVIGISPRGIDGVAFSTVNDGPGCGSR